MDDPAFQEICTDFLELHRLVTRLQESPAESAQRMLIDYQAALIELETEVQIVLERAG